MVKVFEYLQVSCGQEHTAVGSESCGTCKKIKNCLNPHRVLFVGVFVWDYEIVFKSVKN